MALPQMFLISLGVTAFSFVLFLAGFASNVWFSFPGGESTMGLWKFCAGTVCVAIESAFDQLYVARLFCSVAFILIIVYIVFMLLFGFKAAVKLYAVVAYCCLLTAGILNFWGPVAYISAKGTFGAAEPDVGWGGILMIIAGIIQIVAAVLVILPVRQGRVEFVTTS